MIWEVTWQWTLLDPSPEIAVKPSHPLILEGDFFFSCRKCQRLVLVAKFPPVNRSLSSFLLDQRRYVKEDSNDAKKERMERKYGNPKELFPLSLVSLLF